MTKEAPDSAGRGDSPGWPRVLLLVGALSLLRLLWLAGGPVDLYGDEAQYWIWAKAPAFGYYSKPPLVAWLIAASTALFGDGTLAIKLPSVLCHAGTACVLYAIGRERWGHGAGFWAAILWSTMPAVSLSALIISTDPPLLLFWALALHAFLRALDRPGIGWWAAAGLWAGLGLLSKYAMAYFLVSAALCLLATPALRPLLWRRLPWLVGPALLVLSPNLLWNLTNGFATFRHTGDNANLGGRLFNPGELAEFAAAQFAVFGPVPMALLLAALWLALRGGDGTARRIAFFVWPTLAVALTIAFLSRAHANWAAPAYVGGTVLAAGWAVGHGWRRLLAWTAAAHLALAALVMAGPGLLRQAGYELPPRHDPWRRVSGWSDLGEAVTALRRAHPEAGLLVDSRLTLASLVYYVRPFAFDVVKWNPDGVANDHFELTTHLRADDGRSYILVSNRADPSDILARFAAATPLGMLVPAAPERVRRHHAFLVSGFRGYR